MKTIHHATRKRIIREHEENERLVLYVGGMRFIDMSLAQIRRCNNFSDPQRGEIRLELGHQLRAFNKTAARSHPMAAAANLEPNPPYIPPRTKWTRIRKHFTKASLLKLWKKLWYCPDY